MPEYLAPGVYVEEINTGPKPIEGVSTSVAGFVGIAERGPEDVRYITSWLQFQRWYGGHMPVETTYTIHAVQGFFDNGGQRCYVSRIVEKAATLAQLPLGADLRLLAVGRGVWGNNIYIRIKKASQAEQNVKRAENWIRVQLIYFRDAANLPSPPVDPFDSDQLQNPDRREPDVVEDYDNLSLIPGTSNFLVTVLNEASKLVAIENKKPSQAPTGIAPTGFTALAGGTGGTGSPAPDKTDYQGDIDPVAGVADALLGQGRGLKAMEAVTDISLILLPDQVNDGNLTDEVVKHCDLLKDRFAVLATKRSFKSEDTPARPSKDTSYGGQYYPWIWVYDPLSREDVLVPPSGHVAGLIARTDLDQGVHKPPANAVIVGAKDLHRPVTKGDSMKLNPVGINCIRDFRSDGRGIRLWGARTMSSDPEWKYVNVRRLFLFIEKSIDRGTQWVVFEPNSETTWARVARTITSFLVNVWRSGALMGTTQDQAFFVKCDRTTMTQDDIDNGRLICYIGIAPVKPAEFVIFRIGQKTAESQS